MAHDDDWPRAAGECFGPPRCEAACRLDAADARQRLRTLTRAEWAVLEWITLGRTNKEIARILSKSEFTVKTHVQRMLAKTGADNRIHLSTLAIQCFAARASAFERA